MTNSLTGTVSQISPETLSVVQTIPVGNGPTGKTIGTENPGLGAGRSLRRSPVSRRCQSTLASPEGIREIFDRFFTGQVVPGPDIDGVETWQFVGHANPDGLAELESPQDLWDNDRAGLKMLARAVNLSIVAGRDDHLPRRIELTFELSEEEHKQVSAFYEGDFQGWSRNDIEAKLVLSRFGEPVSYDPPTDTAR